MGYLAGIVFVFVLIQWVHAMINLVFYQRVHRSATPYHDLVSILIPARNEEENMAALLTSLRKITGKNIEIIVYDDQSTDRTAEIVRGMAKGDHRIRLVTGQKLKAGWLGKNYACHLLAQEARGKYFLFLDADVMLCGTIVEDAVQTMKNQQLGLLSFFPKQLLISSGEKVTVPIMNYILCTLLPLILVRVSPFSSHAAANGQFMLFTASAYQQMTPHGVFKNSPVEDILIARLFKNNGLKVACLLGEDNVTCRMYKSYGEALNGFTKNVLMFFGNQPLLALLFWAFIALGFFAIIPMGMMVLAGYVVIVLTTRIIVSCISRQSVLWNIVFMIPQVLFLLHVIVRAILVKHQRNYTWKERKVY